MGLIAAPHGLGRFGHGARLICAVHAACWCVPGLPSGSPAVHNVCLAHASRHSHRSPSRASLRNTTLRLRLAVDGRLAGWLGSPSWAPSWLAMLQGSGRCHLMVRGWLVLVVVDCGNAIGSVPSTRVACAALHQHQEETSWHLRSTAHYHRPAQHLVQHHADKGSRGRIVDRVCIPVSTKWYQLGKWC